MREIRTKSDPLGLAHIFSHKCVPEVVVEDCTHLLVLHSYQVDEAWYIFRSLLAAKKPTLNPISILCLKIFKTAQKSSPERNRRVSLRGVSSFPEP